MPLDFSVKSFARKVTMTKSLQYKCAEFPQLGFQVGPWKPTCVYFEEWSGNGETVV